MIYVIPGYKRHEDVPGYYSWRSLKSRCLNPNKPRYETYGARGISVDVRWMSFAGFYADMGVRPTAQHSIDRIDNDKGYEPGNCRWATPVEQASNTRKVRPIIREDGAAFPTLQSAARSVGRDASSLSTALKRGQRCGGFLWRDAQ